jgi:hypothetical protein
MHDDGIVKYQCTWQHEPAGADLDISALNSIRSWLYENKLIGVNVDGIGYGNISSRFREDQFVISGSATGHLPVLTVEHYSLVTSFDLERNHLTCRGPIQASSESMSHGVLYRLDHLISAVIHVHHEGMWRFFREIVPTTASGIEYGTPGMAHEIARLYQTTALPHQKFMIMGGHFEGVISFGASMEEALSVLMEYWRVFGQRT